MKQIGLLVINEKNVWDLLDSKQIGRKVRKEFFLQGKIIKTVLIIWKELKKKVKDELGMEYSVDNIREKLG